VTTLLLTGAGGSAAANFHEALRRSDRGYFVVGADVSPVRLHLSRTDARVVIPGVNDGSYLEALCAVIDRWQVDVLHPQPDPEVQAVSRLRDELPTATYLPSREAIVAAADKSVLARILAEQGIAVPVTVHFSAMRTVREQTDELLAGHERAWIRARVGAGARAALPVRSGRQAEAWVAWWVSEKGMKPEDFTASELLPGREFAYQSVWQNGELVAGQARERLEYLYGHLTPSGQTSTPAVARTVTIPVVDQTACAAIKALDPNPRGVYCVDLKEGADGRPKVTEINAGRFFTTSNFFAAAGLNMPDMLVRCAAGEQLERLGSSPLEADLYWIRMVDMGYVLVSGDELDPWPRPDR